MKVPEQSTFREDGWWHRQAQRQKMSLPGAGLSTMISMISMIFSNHGLVIVVIAVIVSGAIAVIVVIVVRTYACMLLLLMVALMFSHPCWPQPHETRVETDETMKLLLASAP